MNRIIFITFAMFLMLFASDAFAQGEKQQHKPFDFETFRARRNAFLIAEVGLTPSEAAAFIPLCDELQQKKFELGRETRKYARSLRDKKNPTDAEYAKLVDDYLDLNIKEAQLEKEYFKKFKKILSPKKLYDYQRAEAKFAREFMKKEKEKEKDIRPKDIKK